MRLDESSGSCRGKSNRNSNDGNSEDEYGKGFATELRIVEVQGELEAQSGAGLAPTAQCYLIGRLGARFTQNCYHLPAPTGPVLTVDSGARCKQPLAIGVAKLATRFPFSVFSTTFHHPRPNLETKADPQETFWDYTDCKLNEVSLAAKSHIQAPNLDRRSPNPSISRRQNDSRFPTRAALPTHDDGLYALSSRTILAK